MNTTPSQSVSLKILLLALSLLWSFGAVYQAEADTSVSSNIDQDSTWVASSSPYIIQGDVTIATGATLTIGAGTIVKFAGQNSLRVNGSLNVNGTAVNRVYFTSINDDAVGGDTNGSGPAAKAEDWRSVIFLAGSTGSVNYATVRYSGYAIGGPDTAPAIYNQGGTITVDNSAISDGYAFGFGQTAGSLKVSNSTININGFGVGIKGGNVELVGNIIDSNLGIIDDGDSDLKLTNNTIRNSLGSAVTFYPNKQRSVVQSGNTVTNNRYNGILLRGPVTSTFRLSAGELPYVVIDSSGSDTGMGQLTFSGQSLSVATNGVLNIDPGVVIKFTPLARLAVSGTVNAIGTTEAPITFTSIFDDSDGSNTWDVDNTAPAKGDWGDIQVSNTGKLFIEHALLRYGGRSQGGSGSMLFNQGGTIDVRYSTIKDSEGIGVRHIAGVTTLRNNNITDHSNYGAIYEGGAGGNIDAINNYWGSATGPYHATNPGGSGTMVSDNVLFKPFLTAPYGTATTSDCCSSVLFLPGIMGSRLYDSNGSKLWETNVANRARNIGRLKLNSNGESLNDITIGEVIDEFGALEGIGLDLYKSFFDDLGKAMDDDLIAAYMPYSYDWRLSAKDNVADGDLKSKLRSLAETSKTGKVTIVAHSNGGLVAKELVNELGTEAATLIDKIVFVGVPQLGTPQAIARLLHGYDGGIAGHLTDAQARSFAQNSPMAYQLLPHYDYFSSEGAYLYNAPVVRFVPGAATNGFINYYGQKVENIPTLNRFIAGEDGRSQPADSDLTVPAKGNVGLIEKVSGQTIGLSGDWKIPAGIEVHQVAGTGEDTVSGIVYKTKDICTKWVFTNNQFYCPQKEKTLTYDPVFTVSGDGTVVEHSALAMAESSGDVTRWWIDLKKFSTKNRHLIGPLHRDHKNLFEIQDVSDLVIKNLIATSTDFSRYDYISTSRIAHTNTNRLTMTLRSPLSLAYTESDGTVVDEQNPYGKHSRYTRFGEVQLIDVFDGEEGSIDMQGLKRGSFDLDVKEVKDGVVVAFTNFSAIPSIASTSVSMIVDGGAIADLDDLVVDFNNDGASDVTIEPKEDGKVSLPTIPAPSPVIKAQIVKLQRVINTKVSDRVAKQDLKNRASNLLTLYNNWEKASATSKTNFAMKIRLEVNAIEKQIVKYQKTKKIKRGVAANLNRLLKSIKKSL